jgi:hypothetical protein
MGPVLRNLLLAVSGLAWVAMMYHLCRSEVLPYFEYRSTPTYHSVLRNRVDRQIVRRSIHMGQEAVGESVTAFAPGPRETRRIVTRFEMSLEGLLKMMGMGNQLSAAVDRVSVVSEQRIGAGYRLDSFLMKGQILVPVEIEGIREGDQMRISYHVATMQGESVLPFDHSAMLGGGYTPLQGIGRPQIGKRWKLQSLDPNVFMGKPKLVTIFARIEDVETIEVLGKRVQAYRIEFRKDLNKELPLSRMWVDEEGEVLLEEMQVFNLQCRIVLEEKREATAKEIEEFLEKK